MNFPLLHRDREGQTLLLFVFFLIVLVIFAGLAVDVGFAYVTKAKMAKGLDAAALTAARYVYQGQTVATQKARAAFTANYGSTTRDVSAPVMNINYSTDSTTGQLSIQLSASTDIRTYFVRVLPMWKTFNVNARAASTRSAAVISLVLDRSGSMGGNGGSSQLGPAVTGFLDFFDDGVDMMAENSYSSAGRNDVPMGQPFKAAIAASVNSFSYQGYTCCEEGLRRGLEQNRTITSPGAIKIIVFFTDGLANTFNYTFNCGNRNINYIKNLFDPISGNSADSGCTIPATIPSVNPARGTVNTSHQCVTDGPDAMQLEAADRAVAVADLARTESNVVFCVGLGSGSATECGQPVPNLEFLARIANTPDSPNYDPNLPVGKVVVSNASGLAGAFQQIALAILPRLTQ
jgi:Flp pilus assembly protein TadG